MPGDFWQGTARRQSRGKATESLPVKFENLVDQQHFRRRIKRGGEPQAGAHARGVGGQRVVDLIAQTGKWYVTDHTLFLLPNCSKIGGHFKFEGYPVRRFLIRVDVAGIDPRLAWNDPPTAGWSDDSGRVRAWVWDGQFHESTGGFSFRSSITHEITLSDTIGPHVDVCIDASGTGVIKPDSLGLHPLYCGAWRNVTVASNCPHRVADALASDGVTVRKSLSMSALLAACERPIGLETGFENIRCTPFGAEIVIDPNRGIRCTPSREPLGAPCNEILRGVEVDAVIDDCAGEMIQRLDRWVSQAPDAPTLLLTGGLDSRMVLALVIEAGRLDDVNVVTYGHDQSPDVVVAAELTKRLGVPHAVRPPRERVGLRDHVRRTAGMLSCRMRSQPEAEDSVILHGLMGETLRSNVRTNAPLRTRAQVIAGWIQPHAHAGLLQWDAQASALTQGLKALVQSLDGGPRPEMGLDAFYIQHVVRRWISARPEFFANKVFPLYSPRAVALALKLGWKARRDAVIHKTVIARAGGPLLHVPYAARPEPRAVPELSSLGIDESRLSPDDVAASFHKKTPANRVPRTRVGVAVSGENIVMARYREFVAEARNSAIWNVLDREKLRAALDNFTTLDVRSRQEVDSAMAGVLWHS